MNSDSDNFLPEKPKRRPRYGGTHPRRFQDKYKELNPNKYPETVQKVMDSGKTPAGMHRPIMLQEILEVLSPKPGQIAVDCTLGYGGHAAELLKRIQPGGKLLGLDVDPMELPKTTERLRNLMAGAGPENLITTLSNFAGLPQVLARLEINGADLILADLGVSSMQLDNPERGFSFKLEGPLDLRLNPSRGQPAAAWLSRATADELSAALEENADERFAREITEGIVQARVLAPIARTTELSRIVRASLSKRSDKDKEAAVRRVFQALRIQVNDEFGALEAFLRNLPHCLRPGGRAAVITFHSGEDRRVKKAFQAGNSQGVYSGIAEEVIRPTPEEQHSNPRSTSAKLRWAERSQGA